MSYGLGIDIGMTYTAAAVSRIDDEGPGTPEVVSLGTHSAAVASVMFVGADGHILMGDEADRRALTDPHRVVREYKRRVGDEVPLRLGNETHTAQAIIARTVRWVIQRVAEREGEPAEHVVLTHPASWGRYKTSLLVEALAEAGVADVSLLTEPEAAAVKYASLARVDDGAAIAVYDLGGGTFDAAVVRKLAWNSFELLGTPDGLDNLGGVDFDEAVFAHVRAALADEISRLDHSDPYTPAAIARLRRECTEAKEALSHDTEVTIPVLLPGVSTQVRLVRSEFERMIGDELRTTIESLSRVVASAGLTTDDLDAVLLVGGSSRIPLVSELVSTALERSVAVDADAKSTIAAGAALAAAHIVENERLRTAPIALPAFDDADAAEAGDPLQPPRRPPLASFEPVLDDAESTPRHGHRVKALAAAGLISVALVGTAAAFLPFGTTSASGSADNPSIATDAGVTGTLDTTAAPDDKGSTAGTSATGGRETEDDAAASRSASRSASANTTPAGGPSSESPGAGTSTPLDPTTGTTTTPTGEGTSTPTSTATSTIEPTTTSATETPTETTVPEAIPAGEGTPAA